MADSLLMARIQNVDTKVELIGLALEQPPSSASRIKVLELIPRIPDRTIKR